MRGYRDSAETARARLAEIEADLAERRAEAATLSRKLDDALDTVPETPFELQARARRRLAVGGALGAVAACAFITAAGGLSQDRNIFAGLMVGGLVTAIAGIDVSVLLRRPKRTREQLARVLADTKDESIAGVDLASTRERIQALEAECTGLEQEAILCRSLLEHAGDPPENAPESDDEGEARRRA
ncbi:MAG TPA: hypothetical protein VF407_25140 [Polyangiaceae bacterium]